MLCSYWSRRTKPSRFQEDVAAAAAGVTGGEWLAGTVGVVIAVALFTSVSAMTMVGPRVYAQVADDGLLPGAPRLKARAASYLGFSLALCSVATVRSLFVVARRRPGIAARLPGSPWAPFAFVSLTLLFAALAPTRCPWEMIAVVATFLSGLLLYAVLTRSSADKEPR